MAHQDKKGKKGKKGKKEGAERQAAGAGAQDPATAGTQEELRSLAQSLVQERDRLTAELAQAKEKIADLEARNAEAAERLGSIIASLESLMDEENS